MNPRAKRGNGTARIRLPCQDALLEIEVTDDGSRTLINKATGDSYHSSSGALSETRAVYLQNSGVAERLSAHRATRVLEIGLGTGMGMFVTVDQAVQHGTPLDYLAIEHRWLPAAVVRELSPESWVENTAVVSDYLQWRATIPHDGRSRLGDDVPVLSAEPHDKIQAPMFHWQAGPEQIVQIHVVDVLSWQFDGEPFDAIYFDPFAPDTNSELWQTPTLQLMYKLLNTAGRLVTYCVKREVRDRLAAVGFEVQKIRGPEGGKREVLVAVRR
ncbi:tRNA (5-methylaminomethyl-2-thiouridine)(34)-methyltransferase MnmD [Novipirellula caenicola]|uniref:tRNA 5-methylaminomethyl-2-thiouridine biosynthesis bifunctional protein MnmC n=1 Tax=Novipirellula caenicola TaxID=1536901 RepID=A0ABP9VKU9_9BACT